jgi:CubicO group peptidase (beta-lactamase class C family)
VNSGMLLQAESLQAMWEPQRTKSGEESDYGFGWRIFERGDHKIVGHSGGQSGVATFFMLCPDKHVAAAVMCNLQHAKLQPLCRRLLDAAMDESAGESR